MLRAPPDNYPVLTITPERGILLSPGSDEIKHDEF